MVTISVIVPVYNVEKYVGKCIDSIINQTHKDLEIILVDDGSTDNSGKICDEYSKMDNRIKVFHKANGGLISAWYEGLSKAQGHYVGFVDGDDYIANNMYELLYDTITRDESELAICNVINEKNGVKIVQDMLPSGVYDGEELQDIKNKLFPSEKSNGDILKFYRVNKIFIKDKLKESLKYLNENVTYLEDMITTFPYILSCDKISIINVPCYYYVQRDASITKTQDIIKNLRSIKLAIDIAQKEAEDIGYKDKYIFEYSMENAILSAINCKLPHRQSKINYNKLFEFARENQIQFVNPHFNKMYKMKVFLLKHKMYTLMFCLLKIKQKISN
ncbi:MAG: glycosyltransferase family 2 protein [Clostridia bacterium]|nr:glycosyltransferase family 2 protein [Clostridia bacterium]MDY5264182.1 glycosyltransferase family 2 protein [Eubacteriales bacterium]MDY5440131.1 glycosyltransferase family 2 protein [Eubacteriales bacterium]